MTLFGHPLASLLVIFLPATLPALLFSNAADVGAAERARRLDSLTNVRGRKLKVDVTCDLCKNVAQNFIAELKEGAPLATVVNQAVELCVVGGFGNEFDCRYEIEMLAVIRNSTWNYF
jgi:hypothetical protein